MKQKLFLGVSQQLKMTPQLQQAIRLLQLSSLELQLEIKENLYTNPLLEVDESNSSTEQAETETATETSDVFEPDTAETTDTEYFSLRKGSAPESGSDQIFEKEATQTLHEYLEWQLTLGHLSLSDLIIGHTIIDSIDDDGLLKASLEEIQNACELDEPPELDEVEAVLHRIQRFDPPGVGARDMRECLLIQLNMLNNEDSSSDCAELIVDKFLPLVSNGDLSALVKQSRRTEQDILCALELLKTLNPRPGSQYGAEDADYIVPDVIVTKAKGNWVVSLNPETLPKIRLATQYTEIVSRISDEEKEYLKNKTQEAKWFIRSLESRHDTLIKVAKSVVTHQLDFFEKGTEYMKPLILRDLAEELGFHESTISRATNQKYLSCPSGIFELKYFFSSQVATTSGGEASSTAIKALIQKLVASENPQKPLSDSKLAVLLKEEGIIVARRTVAKYREMQGIESSSNRKRLT